MAGALDSYMKKRSIDMEVKDQGDGTARRGRIKQRVDDWERARVPNAVRQDPGSVVREGERQELLDINSRPLSNKSQMQDALGPEDFDLGRYESELKEIVNRDYLDNEVDENGWISTFDKDGWEIMYNVNTGRYYHPGSTPSDADVDYIDQESVDAFNNKTDALNVFLHKKKVKESGRALTDDEIKRYKK